MAIGTHISIITLKVNGLNAPTKDTAWPKGLNKTKQNKTKTHIYAVTRNPVQTSRHID